MSIIPVSARDSIDATPTARTSSSAARHPVTDSTVPNLGRSPNKEIRDPQAHQSSAPMPEDEVRVQRDSTDGHIVIKYMDASGRLILQIPSSQVLGLARAIDQALEEQANVPATESGDLQPGEGGKF